MIMGLMMAKKSDNPVHTRKRQLPEKARKYVWKPGQSGNPKGRPKGSRVAFAETFIKDFMEDWNQYGAQAIQKVREEDTTNYVKVAASLLPKDFNINLSSEAELEKFLEQFTDKELADFVTGVTALGARSKEATDKAPVRSKPSSVH